MKQFAYLKIVTEKDEGIVQKGVNEGGPFAHSTILKVLQFDL